MTGPEQDQTRPGGGGLESVGDANSTVTPTPDIATATDPAPFQVMPALTAEESARDWLARIPTPEALIGALDVAAIESAAGALRADRRAR